MSSHELDSIMLYIHPPLAIIGYVFIFLFTAGILFGRFQKKKLTGWFGIAAWLFTFLGLASGMLWAQTAWGSYWSWDPKETWSFVTWIIYAIYLHVRLNKGWKNKKAAWYAIIGFAAVIFTYIGVNTLLSGFHSYAL